MPAGVGGRENSLRNMIVGLEGIASEIGTATATAGAATCNDLIGKITTESLTTAAGVEYTLTITNSQVAAGDIVFASVDALTSAGTPGIGGCKVTANTIVITVTNLHTSAAFDNVIQVNYMVVKNLVGLP